MIQIIQEGEGGGKVLREIAKPVPEGLFISDELARIVSDMTEALEKCPEGVAIAAPQIGISYRIFLVRMDRVVIGEVALVDIYINPEIIKTSRKRVYLDEGCLSVHGTYGITNRHERVTIKARRFDGSHFQRGAGGLLAQIFEHETDHLNGILFIDHAELSATGKADEVSSIGLAAGALTSSALPVVHPVRFAYFGTPKVSSDTLEILIKNGFVPSVVVTSPDAPKGRGLILTQSETKKIALAHHIPVFSPEKLDEETIHKTILEISDFKCDYALVVAYGKIFPEKLINLFPQGVLNVHYSLLPKYRGATPVESTLLFGDSETGVTIQKMVKELDAGDIIAQEVIKIEENDTARELRPRLIEKGAKLLVAVLPGYLQNKIMPIVQDATRATRACKLKKEDGLISLDAPAEENWKKYRAYADSIGTYFFESDKRMKITRMKITKASYKQSSGNTRAQFIIERVIPEGKKEREYVIHQDAASF